MSAPESFCDSVLCDRVIVRALSAAGSIRDSGWESVEQLKMLLPNSELHDAKESMLWRDQGVRWMCSR